jgi:pimeloyl-ACP methyl ester carboxylesterase
MSKLARSVVVAVTVAGTALALGVPAAAGHPQRAKPTIVLVHGAWADASGWDKVIGRLQHDGYTVLAAPDPLRGLSDDAAYLAAFLQQRTTGPVILVGHSYGGAVISSAALSDPDVVGLVYVNAFVPDQGESVLGLQAGGGDPNALFDFVQYPGAPAGDADLYIKTAVYPQVFAADLPAATAAKMSAAQRPIAFSALLEPSGPVAWKALPSWYVLGTADNILPPTLQQQMADRAKSKVTKVNASHLSMVSKPDVVTTVIESAARATS